MVERERLKGRHRAPYLVLSTGHKFFAASKTADDVLSSAISNERRLRDSLLAPFDIEGQRWRSETLSLKHSSRHSKRDRKFVDPTTEYVGIELTAALSCDFFESITAAG